MNTFLLVSLMSTVMLFFSLPLFLQYQLGLFTNSHMLSYTISALMSYTFFHFGYLKTIKRNKHIEIDNIFTVNELKHEKELLTQKLDLMENLIASDSLTGIWNKNYCFTRLEEEFRRVKRNKGTFSVLMIDVDRFKIINDTYGHPVGDNYLQTLAKTLRDSIRLSDVPCRYGGDEFLILLPDTPAEGAYRTAEKLLEKTRSINIIKDHFMTISIGICSNCEDFQDSTEIINCADYALYQAKKAGRNCSFFYENANNVSKH